MNTVFHLTKLHEHENELRSEVENHRQRDQQSRQRRLHHIHAAIENLRAAGMHEQAEQLQQQAQKEKNSTGNQWKHSVVEQHVFRDLPIEVFDTTRHQGFASPSQNGEILRLRRDMDEMRGQMHLIDLINPTFRTSGI